MKSFIIYITFHLAALSVASAQVNCSSAFNDKMLVLKSGQRVFTKAIGLRYALSKAIGDSNVVGALNHFVVFYPINTQVPSEGNIHVLKGSGTGFLGETDRMIPIENLIPSTKSSLTVRFPDIGITHEIEIGRIFLKVPIGLSSYDVRVLGIFNDNTVAIEVFDLANSFSIGKILRVKADIFKQAI